jgi:hypothetical protein
LAARAENIDLWRLLKNSVSISDSLDIGLLVITATYLRAPNKTGVEI